MIQIDEADTDDFCDQWLRNQTNEELREFIVALVKDKFTIDQVNQLETDLSKLRADMMEEKIITFGGDKK